MNGISNINGSRGIYAANMEPMDQNKKAGRPEGPPPPPPPMNMEISQLGQLFKAVDESGESAQSDLTQFHEDLFAALKSGSFDAEALAENASDIIKEIAENTGINLAEALTEFQENAPKPNANGGLRQGPPPKAPDLNS